MAVTTHNTMAVTVHSGFGAQENKGFLGRSVAKNLPTMQETDLIPGWETSPGEGNGNPLQYFCLGKPIDRGAWWAIVRGVAKERDLT